MSTRLDPEIYRAWKRAGRRIAMLTAYDYPMARMLDEAGVDLLLVGDSVGMVVLGFEDTTHVTMEAMLHHTAAVARGTKRAPIIADLPKASYETPEQALENARRLMAAGADAVKLEGGESHRAQVAAITATGIPVMGHIGMLPQRVKEEGGYRIKGKTPESAAQLLRDAQALQEAGAFAVVLELVAAPTAAQIQAAIEIPTIGIGSGTDCDGQVLVIHDLIGLFPWFRPKFAKAAAETHESITAGVKEFIARVQNPPVA